MDYREHALDVLRFVDPDRRGGWWAYEQCKQLLEGLKVPDKEREALLHEVVGELRL